MERIITKSFARLMGRGTHRGFITYEELKSLVKEIFQMKIYRKLLFIF